MDPQGRVLAMVGGYNYDKANLTGGSGRRQPGSAFKPFVYLPPG